MEWKPSDFQRSFGTSHSFFDHSKNKKARSHRYAPKPSCFSKMVEPPHARASCPRSGAAPTDLSRTSRATYRAKSLSRSPAVGLPDRLHHFKKERPRIAARPFFEMVETVGIEPTSESRPSPISTCVFRVLVGLKSSTNKILQAPADHCFASKPPARASQLSH